jgi:hypothetical protein
VNADKSEEIGDGVWLDFLVEGRITAERRSQINFKQPRLALAINQDIEAKKLKTVVLGVRAEHLSSIIDHVLPCNNSLDYDVLDLAKKQLVIESHLL